MSIKQGEYLKRLRQEHKLSQEQLSEVLGISRQSVSKWEQGSSTPDIDNLTKLAKYYGVSVDSLVNGEEDKQTENAPEITEVAANQSDNEGGEDNKDNNENKEKKRKHWIYAAYPILTAIAYCLIGTFVDGAMGWAFGWIVFLTIPLFYTGSAAIKKKKPIIFCYPVLVLIVFLLLGLFKSLWHPAWILFLTIPLFYIITAKMHK